MGTCQAPWGRRSSVPAGTQEDWPKGAVGEGQAVGQGDTPEEGRGTEDQGYQDLGCKETEALREMK